MSKKVFIKTFGCQMNVYDSNRIYDSLKTIGFEKTDNQNQTDCYILNTCHIRDKAKEKVYHEVGRVKKIYQNKKKPIMVIAGCVAQAENDEMFKREPFIDVVIGPQSYHKINNTIKNFLNIKKIEETEIDTIEKFEHFDKIKNSSNKVSSFLTIQEGCDKFCHFCVVPFTRGPEYSRPFKKILQEAEILIKNGVKEITLLGQNVNAYSFIENNKEYRISNLINELEKFSEIKRIRYTTSHPIDMTDDLIECYKYNKKLMPFIHLPIQSGSNKILKLMNRKHTVEQYVDICDKILKNNPEVKFSSDFIVSYPGEEQCDFEDTINLINELEKFSEIKRIRYTTSHPIDMTDDLIECYKYNKKLMPFIHLPIQSGSNKILKLMNRKHTVEQYVDVCDKILKNNPEVKFSSDFIVSYPGEEQCDFEDTINLIKKIKFINSFSFIFSPRPGTKAGEFKTIDNNISKDKLIEMQNLLFEYQIQTNKNFKGRTLSVLIENKMNETKKLFGRNKYLNSVICDGSENNVGKEVIVKVEKYNQNSLFGKIINLDTKAA